MLDSNVHDLVAANPVVKEAIIKHVRDSSMTLISTHVQHDELSRAPASKRDALLTIYGLTEVVQTTGAIWDVSRFDQSTYGTDETNASMDAHMAGNPRHAEDALIASTASGTSDVLVTNETRLASKIKRAGFSVEVWSWDQFITWLGC